MTDVKKDMAEVKELLLQIYEPFEAGQFIMSRQELLRDRIPYDMIKDGKGDEVIRCLKRIIEGVYI